jgi:lysophospholipase L1-like esterase
VHLRAILDRLLEGAEVVNAGVPGYSSYQGRILFEDRCEDLEPDALVVAFGHNDVLTWLTKHQGKLVEISDRDRADHFNYTRTWSRLLQWLLSRRLRPPASPAGDGSPEATLPRVPIEEFRANLEYFAGRAPVVVFVAWARRSALEPDRRERFPTRRLRRYRAAILEMEQAGHVVLDVEELFRKSGLPPERLFLDDVHATKEGGELVARWLARRLRLHVPALRHR